MRLWYRLAPWWVAPAILLALAPVVALLQYRWVAQLSEGERVRMRTGLQSATERAGLELDREVRRLFSVFQGGEPLEEQLRKWSESARYPGMLRRAVVLSSGGCAPSPCPEWLARHRAELPAGQAFGSAPTLQTELAFSEIPAFALAKFAEMEWGSEPGAPSLLGWTVLELDRAFLASTVFPALAHGFLSGDGGGDYRVAVVRRVRPPDLLFESAPGGAGAVLEAPDAQIEVFRFPQESFLGATDRRVFVRKMPRERTPEWTMAVRHRAGSLEAAVKNAQVRNLAMSGVTLTLLASAIALLVVSTRRAHLLAQAQMQYVAGVSHELKTPLAAIRSAGYNLAKGVVTDAARVREYGEITTVRLTHRTRPATNCTVDG